MNGPLVIKSKLRSSSLQDFRERLATETFTNEDILALICEVELLHVDNCKIKDINYKLVKIISEINELAYEHPDESVDINRLRDLTDTYEMNEVKDIDNRVDSIVQQCLSMERMLAQVLHKIELEGQLTAKDEIVNSIQRYIRDLKSR